MLHAARKRKCISTFGYRTVLDVRDRSDVFAGSDAPDPRGPVLGGGRRERRHAAAAHGHVEAPASVADALALRRLRGSGLDGGAVRARGGGYPCVFRPASRLQFHVRN